jgi:hypothetical protein
MMVGGDGLLPTSAGVKVRFDGELTPELREANERSVR